MLVRWIRLLERRLRRLIRGGGDWIGEEGKGGGRGEERL